MNIGEAVAAMWRGVKVARSGWNGRGMWLALQQPDLPSKMSLPYIYMSTAQGDLVPWLASQTDILATDWVLVGVTADPAPAPSGSILASGATMTQMTGQAYTPQLTPAERLVAENLARAALGQAPLPDKSRGNLVGVVGPAKPQPGQHVFEGAPDARQSADVNHKVSRFRPTYRALTPEEMARHDLIKLRADELEHLMTDGKTPDRYGSLAVTSLETAVMWAIKSLTS